MWRIILIFVVLSIVGLFLQSTVPPFGSHSFVTPDLVLITVIFIGLYVRSVWGVLGAFSLGLLSDFATAQYLGPGAAGAMICYWIVVFVSQRVFVEHFIGLIILGFLASLGKQITYLALLLGFVGLKLTWWQISKTVLIEAAFTAVLTPMIVLMLHVLDNKSKPFFGNKKRGLRNY